jgi:tRNA U34 2-thiouridine synthase MnmA/TrmU
LINKKTALALLSGGLDSMLAVKVILGQGIKVEAVNFVTPFCLCDHCSLQNFSSNNNIKVHSIFSGQDFLDIIVNPPHGYGSQMNPCIDCRILMLKKAKQLAEKIGASFIFTGEVLNQRPFSQRKAAMLHIEKEADLEGKILRPLSAKLLPETKPEKEGFVNREKLLSIEGRRRLPQMEKAEELGIRDYPCPAGGCLLTDPRFSERLKEHLNHENSLNLNDVNLLKVGRHFRIGKGKIVVGRNEEENHELMRIAKRNNILWLEAIDFNGPVTLVLGEHKQDFLDKAAAITVRYSDAPKEIFVKIALHNEKDKVVEDILRI